MAQPLLLPPLVPITDLPSQLTPDGGWKYRCSLTLDTETILLKVFASPYTRSTEWPYSALEYLAFVDAGNTANVAALATFGVLGLGARKNRTAVSLAVAELQLHMVAKAPIHRIRGLLALAASDRPDLDGKLIDGPPPIGASKPPSTAPGTERTGVSELERLSKLYREGLLTADEFAAMKRKLIGS